tara:strand:+ start:269 stop:853 length:585 start_codon:yes stop_codon:yes gene_type:complete
MFPFPKINKNMLILTSIVIILLFFRKTTEVFTNKKRFNNNKKRFDKIKNEIIDELKSELHSHDYFGCDAVTDLRNVVKVIKLTIKDMKDQYIQDNKAPFNCNDIIKSMGNKFNDLVVNREVKTDIWYILVKRITDYKTKYCSDGNITIDEIEELTDDMFDQIEELTDGMLCPDSAKRADVKVKTDPHSDKPNAV